MAKLHEITLGLVTLWISAALVSQAKADADAGTAKAVQAPPTPNVQQVHTPEFAAAKRAADHAGAVSTRDLSRLKACMRQHPNIHGQVAPECRAKAQASSASLEKSFKALMRMRKAIGVRTILYDPAPLPSPEPDNQ